jgi:hypothetical protein
LQRQPGSLSAGAIEDTAQGPERYIHLSDEADVLIERGEKAG